jgi:hypothetical protein
VRWLLARGRKDEAKEILEKVAKENKVSISPEVYESLAEEPAVKSGVSVLDLFRYRRLGLRSVNIFFNWFVNSGVYYGLSLNTSNLGGNGNSICPDLKTSHELVILTCTAGSRLLKLCHCWSRRSPRLPVYTSQFTKVWSENRSLWVYACRRSILICLRYHSRYERYNTFYPFISLGYGSLNPFKVFFYLGT